MTAPAMEWCEYRSPEGKPYYFNLKTSQSVWEKPQGLKDYDGKVSLIWSNFLNSFNFVLLKTLKLVDWLLLLEPTLDLYL